MGKLAKLCAVFIPIGILSFIAGGIIMGVSEEPDWDENETTVTTTDVTSIVGYDELSDSSYSFSPNEAQSISIDCTAATINIFKSDSYIVNTENFDQNDLKVECTDENIYIEYSEKKLSDLENGTLSIGIPVSCKKLSLHCNAGDITIDEFMGERIELSVDCGNIEISNSRISESCEINNTLGNVYIYGSYINNLDAELISGNSSIYNTMLNGSNDIDIDVGNCNMALKGSVSDYTFDIETKVGEIDCDYDLEKYDYSDIKIDISVIAGNCSIEFYD